jgi:predicted RNase H-like nuclease (RuvC/YqgF family)
LLELRFEVIKYKTLQENCASLETEVKALGNKAYKFRSKCKALEPDFEAVKESSRVLQSRVQGISDLEKELEASRSKNVEIQEHNERIQMELQLVREESSIRGGSKQRDSMARRARETGGGEMTVYFPSCSVVATIS